MSAPPVLPWLCNDSMGVCTNIGSGGTHATEVECNLARPTVWMWSGPGDGICYTQAYCTTKPSGSYDTCALCKVAHPNAFPPTC